MRILEDIMDSAIEMRDLYQDSRIVAARIHPATCDAIRVELGQAKVGTDWSLLGVPLVVDASVPEGSLEGVR